VEKRAPKSIIPEGKKGIRGSMIVFMEIRAVIGFFSEIRRGETSGFPCVIAGIK
jgi:hypothetical protein